MIPGRLALVGALAMLAVLGAACDTLPGRPRPSERSVRPAEVKDFATLYGQHCAGCHGADGRLGAGRPLNDPVYIALVGEDRLRGIIANGVPGTMMPGFGTGALTGEQVGLLARDIVARWGNPAAAGAPPPYSEADAVAAGSGPGEAARGREVYGKACARCHGDDGRGGKEGGPVVEPAYLALTSPQSLRTTVIAGRTDLGMPDWRKAAPGGALTGQEVSDVVAWLVSQRRPVPGRPASAAGKP
jgi:cytochrome c oxidase cbb3-type subunit 3/ubiquinol-cytochrome c reductase cytochrome c subunit